MTILNALLRKGCTKCLNTGITFVNDGEDDVDEEYCSCYAGQQKQHWDMEAMADLEERERMDMRDYFDAYGF